MIEPQFRLACLVIRAVAFETMPREKRPDVAREIDVVAANRLGAARVQRTREHRRQLKKAACAHFRTSSRSVQFCTYINAPEAADRERWRWKRAGVRHFSRTSPVGSSGRPSAARQPVPEQRQNRCDAAPIC